MNRMKLLIPLLLVAAIAVFISMKANRSVSEDAGAEKPMETVLSSSPFDEASYPAARVVAVEAPVRISRYFEFLDSLATTESHLMHHNLPGDRLIVLANSHLLEKRMQLASANADAVFLPSGSLLNMPDSLTALSLSKTLRSSVLVLDCMSSEAFVLTGMDTLFCTVFHMADSMGRWDTSDSMKGMVLRAHRKACLFPCEEDIHLPALEIKFERIPVPLILAAAGRAEQDLYPDAFNFIWFPPEDMWMLYYLLPPGTPVRWNVVRRENTIRVVH